MCLKPKDFGGLHGVIYHKMELHNHLCENLKSYNMIVIWKHIGKLVVPDSYLVEIIHWRFMTMID
jgi:hypothetical protein